MKFLRVAVDATFAIAACVLLVIAIAVLTIYAWHWDSGAVAAWVQAIGSIGAIGVAIYVSWAQVRNDRIRERERDHAERLRVLEGPMGIMSAVFRYIEQVPTTDSEESEVAEFLEGPWINGFMRAQTALRAIPLHQIPWWGISECVLEMMLCGDVCQGAVNTLNHEFAQRHNTIPISWRKSLTVLQRSIVDARATMRIAAREAENIRGNQR